MSTVSVRRCDICGRYETAYGAVRTAFVKYDKGKHACGVACYLVILARIAHRWLTPTGCA
jgi:hypothetical protein